MPQPSSRATYILLQAGKPASDGRRSQTPNAARGQTFSGAVPLNRSEALPHGPDLVEAGALDGESRLGGNVDRILEHPVDATTAAELAFA